MARGAEISRSGGHVYDLAARLVRSTVNVGSTAGRSTSAQAEAAQAFRAAVARARAGDRVGARALTQHYLDRRLSPRARRAEAEP